MKMSRLRVSKELRSLDAFDQEEILDDALIPLKRKYMWEAVEILKDTISTHISHTEETSVRKDVVLSELDCQAVHAHRALNR
jgi:hypothetical protein